jgi:hypothetical protein
MSGDKNDMNTICDRALGTDDIGTRADFFDHVLYVKIGTEPAGSADPGSGL